MKEWANWVKYYRAGGGGTWPRDAFESLLDYFDEKMNTEKEIWHQTDKPLPDGWYGRKCKVDDPDPECIEVCNGIMVDKRPRDSHGLEWEVYEHSQFEGFWWCGPLEFPAQERE